MGKTRRVQSGSTRINCHHTIITVWRNTEDADVGRFALITELPDTEITMYEELRGTR